MAKAKMKFRSHRAGVVLCCLALLVLLMQGVSWFSLGHQSTYSKQMKELARAMTRSVALRLSPLLEDGENNRAQIQAQLKQMMDNPRILDVLVYNNDGALLARNPEIITVPGRLAIDGMRVGSDLTHYIVQPIENNNGPTGFLRVTLDTRLSVSEAKHRDVSTAILRLLLLVALATGVILTRTLSQAVTADKKK